MDAQDLRGIQAPFKARYANEPEADVITLRAEGTVGGDGIACSVQTSCVMVEAGLHPSAGGGGVQACSGDMLLEALVACTGVTLRAVATAIEVDVRGGTVHAEGDLDVRGTLGVAKDAPVGFKDIRLHFEFETGADGSQIATLLKLTERHCVVFQTLRAAPAIGFSHSVS